MFRGRDMPKPIRMAKAHQPSETDLESPAPPGAAAPSTIDAGALPAGAAASQGPAAGARDLQAQLADAFSQANEAGEAVLDEERYPLALTFGLTILVCSIFWTMAALGVRSLLAG